MKALYSNAANVFREQFKNKNINKIKQNKTTMNVLSFEDICRIHVQNQINNLTRNIQNDEERNEERNNLLADTNDWFSFTRSEPRPNSSTTRFDVLRDEEEIEELLFDLHEEDDSDEAEEEKDRAVDEATKKDNHECSICLENREKYYTLIPCGHVLCSDCIHQIKKSKKKNKCFICRGKVKKIFRIYL